MPTPNGSHNQPRFDLNDDADFAADLTTVSEYAAKVGNIRVGTTTERNAATGNDVWEGLLWNDTTQGKTYRYTGGAWAVYTAIPVVRDQQVSVRTGATVGIAAGQSVDLAGATLAAVPSGVVATIRANGFMLIGRNAASGAAAGTLRPIINNQSTTNYVHYHTQSLAAAQPVAVAKAWNYQITGTGAGIPILFRVASESTGATGAIYDYTFDYTLEY